MVLRVGDLPTSKPLRTWLGGLDAVTVRLDATGTWQDPDHVSDLVLPHPSAPALAALTSAVRSLDMERDPEWMTTWRAADDAAATAIDAVLVPQQSAAAGVPLNEPLVARELLSGLPSEAALFVAASMPIRDVETFAPARDAPPRVMANRGANGIDGTIATAYGVAALHDGPTVLLLGDVTLAHDIGSLLTARRTGIPLTLVLIDNDGGGIFDFLAVSGEQDAYTAHVLTPTGLDPEKVCDLYGLAYQPVAELGELRVALEACLQFKGTALLHVRTDRAENVALHRRGLGGGRERPGLTARTPVRVDVMADWDDVRRIALGLPGTTEGVSRTHATWTVGKRLFVWERPLLQTELRALGEAAPDGPILGARVEHVTAKEALLVDPSGVFFTTPHFDGYPAILVRLGAIDVAELDEVIVEAWLNRAPPKLRGAVPRARRRLERQDR